MIMNLLETIQQAASRGYEVSFFQYDGFLRLCVRTFVTASSFGFEIPDGYVAHVAVTEDKVCEKIIALIDEQDKVFAKSTA